MNESIDLDAYFARIGYTGPRTAELKTLEALHAAHPRAIPFENLDPLLGRPVKLDPAALQAKLVAGRRGGYCYEQNGLFRAVLRALGFKVKGLAARVLWTAPPDRVPPRSHMLLGVDLPEGPFIADVGFGGLTRTAPLRLEPGLEQPTLHETFRLVDIDGEFQLQVRLPDGWTPMYQFDLTEAAPIDYEMANWFVATHPSSRFVNELLAAFVAEDRRYALRDTQLSVYYPGGRMERRVLTPDELAHVLHEEFGLARPVGDLIGLYRRLASK